MVKMNLEYLLENADRFAYEYRKHFEGDEMPVRHFITDQGIVIITTEKLCVFYYDRVIRFQDDILQHTSVKVVGNNKYIITIKELDFEVELKNIDEAVLFEKYYRKYKN